MNLHSILVGIRSLVFIPASIIVLAALATLMVFLKIDERYINGPLAHQWARIVLWLADLRLDVEGAGRIPSPDEPYIVVMNHQSNMDIPAVLCALTLQLRFVGKVELLKVPIFGRALLRAGHFLIDRKNHEVARKGLHEAGMQLRKKGVSLVLAPEGTRSENGALGTFKKGAFVTAIETGIPILPVTLDGTWRSLPKGTLWARSAEAKITIHDPLPTKDLAYEDRDRLSEMVRAIMERTLEEGRGNGE